MSDAQATLSSFVNSGALAPAIELITLVTSGQITAVQAMAAVDAIAPNVDINKLVYFLASRWRRLRACKIAAPQEIDALFHEGRLTASAAVADIAAITNAAPSGGSVMSAISTATAVSALIGIDSNAQSVAFSTAVAQQIAGIFVNPPANYSQAAVLAAINAAVGINEISAVSATALMIQLAGAAPQ